MGPPEREPSRGRGTPGRPAPVPTYAGLRGKLRQPRGHGTPGTRPGLHNADNRAAHNYKRRDNGSAPRPGGVTASGHIIAAHTEMGRRSEAGTAISDSLSPRTCPALETDPAACQ